MDKEIALTTQEAEWLLAHLLEIVEAITTERPLRGDWVRDTFMFAAVLLNRVREAEGGADPRMN